LTISIVLTGNRSEMRNWFMLGHHCRGLEWGGVVHRRSRADLILRLVTDLRWLSVLLPIWLVGVVSGRSLVMKRGLSPMAILTRVRVRRQSIKYQSLLWSASFKKYSLGSNVPLEEEEPTHTVPS
jgi:hypothetical protein